MKPVDQTIFIPPQANCFAACLASILERPLSEVPNFMEDLDWVSSYNAWLERFDLFLLLVVLPLPPAVKIQTFPGYSIVTGEGPRGFLHSVVYKCNELVHDPHPSRAGITSFYDVAFLVRRMEKI
jgi:hypothetical protein